MDKKRTIFLIAGHHRAGLYLRPHLRDPGAVPRYQNHVDFQPPVYNEHHECEKLVTNSGRELIKQGFNVKICPFDFDLRGKIRWVNKQSDRRDLLISVHMNSFSEPSTGTEVLYYSGSGRSRAKAEKMANILSETCDLHNRGVHGDLSNRHGRLAIIRDTTPWAFLFEVGFISNPKDMRRVRDFGVQAIIDAIKSNF